MLNGGNFNLSLKKALPANEATTATKLEDIVVKVLNDLCWWHILCAELKHTKIILIFYAVFLRNLCFIKDIATSVNEFETINKEEVLRKVPTSNIPVVCDDEGGSSDESDENCEGGSDNGKDEESSSRLKMTTIRNGCGTKEKCPSIEKKIFKAM